MLQLAQPVAHIITILALAMIITGALRTSSLDLEAALIILPVLSPLLDSEYEDHLLSAIEGLTLLLAR